MPDARQQQPAVAPVVLMIAYHFAPANVIAARRMLNVALEFQHRLGAVAVVSTSNSRFFQQEPVDIGKIRVLRAPTLDYHTLKFWLGYSRTRKVAGHRESRAKDGASTGEKLLNSFPLNVLIGEGGFLYIAFSLMHALRAGKNAGVVFSSFGPFSDHVVAFLYKKIRPDVHWIADFRDFYPHPEARAVYFTAFHRRLLRFLLRDADTVSAASMGLARFLSPMLGKEICLVRNAVTPAPSPVQHGPPLPFFTITYTGRIYNGHYDIRPLLEVLRNLLAEGRIRAETLRLQYAGPNGNLWDAWMADGNLAHLSLNRRQVSHAEARQMQMQSAVNLLMSWSSPNIGGILTGKLYEYLEAGRPILLLMNGPEDSEFSEIFGDLQCGFQHSASNGSSTDLSAFLLDLYDEWIETKNIGRRYNADKLARYSWVSQVKCLAERVRTGIF